LGGTETINVNVRLIAATNRNLQEMVQNGTFRADLYYRLNVFPIVNLPLRDRPEDIPVLVDHFTRKFARRQRKNITKINSQDLKALKQYSFPGNIRELENLIERAVVLNQSEVLSIPLEANSNRVEAGKKVFLSFEEAQREHIIKALRKTDGRVTGPHGAGGLLGLNDRTLVSKMRKLDIRKVEYLIE
jgi:transcriptional regulator with GAF, ATPase, and Fis domain